MRMIFAGVFGGIEGRVLFLFYRAVFLVGFSSYVLGMDKVVREIYLEG